MEAAWIEKRATLRWVLRTHPEWMTKEYTSALGMSVGWVKKWKKRLQEAPAHDLSVLHARSRARKTPHPPPDPRVGERMVLLRLALPVKRVPGARTSQYFLQQDAGLHALGFWLPRSPRTIWKILRKLGLILDPATRHHKPQPRRSPLQEVQVDCKDVSTVPADPNGKQQPVVETCNFVDAGTSVLLAAHTRDDFRAETAFDVVVQFLQHSGLPQMLTFDRDPRWVGSQSGRDFPSALRRFLLCLGIEPNVCPPHQPQKQAYVERSHRSYKYAWLLIHRPSSLQEAIEVTREYQQHYNWERPHQGRSCQNRPPCVAFPHLPPLPELPLEVDPDRWLDRLHGRAYVRHGGADGCVTVDDRSYDVGLEHTGKTVAVLIHAPVRQFEVWEGTTLLKKLTSKGVQGAPMELVHFIAWMREQAVSEERQARLQARARGRGWKQLALWEVH